MRIKLCFQPGPRLLGSLAFIVAVASSGCRRHSDEVDEATSRALSFNEDVPVAGALRIEAEAFDTMTGVTVYPTPPEAPAGVSFIDDGDELVYEAVDLGSPGTFRSLRARFGSPNSGTRMEIWADARGPGGTKVGELITEATGTGFGTPASQATDLAPIGGVRTLIIHFNGAENATEQRNGWGHGIGNFDWFELAPGPAPERRGMRWVKSWNGDIPHGAVAEQAGGARICRVTIADTIYAGRLSGSGCHYATQGACSKASEYEALVSDADLGFSWEAASAAPAGAISAGNGSNGLPRIVCRVQHDDVWYAGGTSDAGCNVAVDGDVVASSTFQVLKKTVKPIGAPTAPAAGNPFGRSVVMPADLPDPAAPLQWTTPLVARSTPTVPNLWVLPPLVVDPNAGRP